MPSVPAVNAARSSRGIRGSRGRHGPAVSSRVWRGRKNANPPTIAVTAVSTQKLRCSGAGAYCTSAPPTMVASASPVAVAAVVAELARRAPSRPPNSTIAAVAGLSESPTPTPMSARPMNTQVRSGARPNAIEPAVSAARPMRMTARRPITSERLPKTMSTGTSTSG